MLIIQWSKVGLCLEFVCAPSLFPGYPIDGNRLSENQSINRYQSIKLVNWYRSIDDQSITTQKSLIDWHRLEQDLKQTSRKFVTHATGRPIIRQFGKPCGRNRPSQRKECIPLHVYSNHPLARHCLSVSQCLRETSG